MPTQRYQNGPSRRHIALFPCKTARSGRRATSVSRWPRRRVLPPRSRQICRPRRRRMWHRRRYRFHLRPEPTRLTGQTVVSGGSGIRTHGGLPHTRFPSVPIRPLSHPSRMSRANLLGCPGGRRVAAGRRGAVGLPRRFGYRLRKRSMLRRSFFVGRPLPRSRRNSGATYSRGGAGGLWSTRHSAASDADTRRSMG